MSDADRERVMTGAAEAALARDVMTRDVVTVPADASVTEAWQALFSSGCTHLMVVSGGRCLGVVDDRTVALEWPSGAFESRRRQVMSLCHGDPVSVAPDATMGDVARAMRASGRTAVAVVATDGRPLGLITAAHFVTVVADSSPAALDERASSGR